MKVRAWDGQAPPDRDWCAAPIPAECECEAVEHRQLIPCKRWTEPYCGRVRAWQRRRQIEAHMSLWFDAGLWVYFLTITVPHDDLNWRFDRPQAHQRMTAAFTELRRDLARVHNRHVLGHVRAHEPHRSEFLHAHAVIGVTGQLPNCGPKELGGINRWRKQRGLSRLQLGDHWCDPDRPCLKRLAERHGLGFTDLKRIRRAGAIGSYLSRFERYLVKGIRADWPPHAHRALASRREIAGVRPPTLTDMRETALRQRLDRDELEDYRYLGHRLYPVIPFQKWYSDCQGGAWRGDEFNVLVDSSDAYRPPVRADPGSARSSPTIVSHDTPRIWHSDVTGELLPDPFTL